MRKKIIILISIILVVFFILLFVVSTNNRYDKKQEKLLKDNYEIKDEIKYLNKSNLYYIIVTSKNLIVLNEDYQEVLKESSTEIEIDKNKEIVYRLNQVMYEEKKVLKDKINYNYYDIYTNELIDTLVVGG